MNITLQKAKIDDCELIHNLQVKSFESLLKKYEDYDTNPGAEGIEKVIQRMEQNCTDYYIIKLSDEAIGAIRIIQMQDNICRISPIFILPEFQGKGYAQQVMLKVEQLYPKACGWRLETIKQENKLNYLYEKLGYKATGREESIKEGMTIVFYSK